MYASSPASSGDLYDVAIVGLGPVGQTLALLLGQRGHRVLVVEKQSQPYPLPRAVHYDPDISRLLDTLGLSEQMERFSTATASYEWQNAARQTLLRFDYAATGEQGWPESSMFHQPTLEAALQEQARRWENIVIRRGVTVVGVRQHEDHVSLDITSRTLKHKQLRAQYVIGADGSNSTIRQYMNTAVEDLGFFYEWLIVDLLPNTERAWEPSNLQVCDPSRPTSAVEGGPGRRRFEFMRMPEDDLEQFNTDETAWELLEPWGITPETDQLERRALYTFQARWATQWRDRRIFLAGDAAHQMPPFYGQGMVSGMRDSANLAWKLDLVLRGLAEEDLLDTYTSERTVHVRHAVGMSVELGRVICQVEPEAVAARDEHMLAQGPLPENVLPPIPPERLGEGAFVDDLTTSAVAGLVSAQGRLGHANAEGERVSDLADRLSVQSTLILLNGLVVDAPTAEQTAAAVPEDLDVVVVRILPTGHPLANAGSGAASNVVTATDDDDRYLPLFASTDLAALVVRPDFFYAGGAMTPEEVPSLPTRLTEAYRLSAA